MRIQYENGDKVTLRRIHDVDASEWDDEGADYDALVIAQENSTVFTITCEACDCDGYYDLIAGDLEVGAISAYHLVPYLKGVSLSVMLDL